MRWWIVGLIFLASVLNYVDRQCLSILAPTIQRDLGLDASGYALILNLFLIAYTAAYLCSGWVVDRIGVRLGFAVFLGWWSMANLLTGWARSAASLGGCRFLLGLGEAGNWTAAPKAVGEWFPAEERGLAVGLYTMGATIGATVAPILIIWLSSAGGWRVPFMVTGAAGLLWLVPWFWLYRAQPRPPDSAPVSAASWGTILRNRLVWRLMAARLLTDPVWYFYQFWFAKYLYDARGLSQKSLSITWVIFLAADLGALLGGWLPGRSIRRGRKPAPARLGVMAVAACLVPLSAVIPAAHALWLVLALAMAATFAQMGWLTNVTALAVDLLPPPLLATAFGFIAAGSVVGGIAMNWAVGHLVGSGSYNAGFFAIACLHPIALLTLWPARRHSSQP